MANKFVLNKSGVRAIYQSTAVLELTKQYAERYEGKKKSFIGYDRAKTIVYGERDKK